MSDIALQPDEPLQAVEEFVQEMGWGYEREEGELMFFVPGRWGEYVFLVTWFPDGRVLHFACTFELPIPDASLPRVQEIMRMINEQLWVGHFDHFPEEKNALFRYAFLCGESSPQHSQLETIVACATEAWNRYFPAFEHAAWSQVSLSDILNGVTMDTEGKA